MRSKYSYIKYRYVIVVATIFYFSISLSASEGGYSMTGMGKSITGSVSGNIASIYWNGVMSMKSNASLLHELEGLQVGIGLELNQYVGLNSIYAIGKGINAYNRHFGTGLLINRIDVQGLAFLTIDDTMNGMGYSGFTRSGESRFSITEVNICFSGSENKFGYGISGKVGYGDGEYKTYLSIGGDIGAQYIIKESIGGVIDTVGIAISLKDVMGNRIFWNNGEKEKSDMLIDAGAGCIIKVEFGILKGFSKRIKVEIGAGIKELNTSSISSKADMIIELMPIDESRYQIKKYIGIIGYNGRRLRSGFKLQFGELMLGFTSGYSFGSITSLINENIDIEITRVF